jgi:dTDP-4-amino-4,6-dideoxygalactose transaminase
LKELALFGGEQANTEPIIPANHIGTAEARAAYEVVAHKALSGFLGGQQRGGEMVCALEDAWARKFRVKHAIACNSATSGLLAACVAADMHRESREHVLVPALTMSATAAVPKFLLRDSPTARLHWADCDRDYFGIDDKAWKVPPYPQVVLVTNLFGHPANLAAIKRLCDKHHTIMIEDNAQSICAMEGESYAGTIGSLGVYSLNVHKAIQSGEGGVVVTDDDHLADRVRGFINHGELGGSADVGLNLRMTEVTAAIAIEQLKRVDLITTLNQEQAKALTRIAQRFPWLRPPLTRQDCTHVYYCWAAKIDPRALPRDLFVRAMAAEGFPFVAGYCDPLYRLAAFGAQDRLCPVAERLHDSELVLFENTLHWLSTNQLGMFEDALRKIDHNITRLRNA